MTDWFHSAELVSLLAQWLPTRRWFPAKDDPLATIESVQCVPLATASDDVRLTLVRLATAEGPLVLQVPLVRLPAAPPGADVVGRVQGGVLVDGAAQPHFLAAWLAAAETGGQVLAAPDGSSPLPELRAGLAGARALGAEQSNTSVLLPSATGGAVLKLFRVLASGENPDVALPVALARAGWHRVPRPVAWLSLPAAGALLGQAGSVVHSGVLATYVPAATDGFTHFTNLLAAGEREQVTQLAGTLGAATAQMHAVLHNLGTADPGQPAALVAKLQAQADWAIGVASVLAPLAGDIKDALAAVAHVGDLPAAHRLHGDYHLGQCLWGADGWYVLDFEGEPLRPLAERTAPDQPARDVAGMLRSFDYAAAVAHLADDELRQAARTAFLAGYRAEELAAPLPEKLVRAYELDKALYEVVYEVRNRPDWVEIPLAGVRRLLADS
ncbi:aminoglycoside phosphotransferase [Buchananella hordeovulneris]|uniref:maltokinase N-terminal cap-like domain-containing protein n=1 Tax=Buchananella hordeovulneris TaxID=52770 RepID=UPI000F5FD17E|nr:aminoglycoside phosphotransferase [Buchananella hordeovulneris]RRD53092.1 aminoglycoside phosphotransferase [Buchananella hordeovulneris]